MYSSTVVGGAILKGVQCLQVSGHSRGSVGGVRPEVLSGGVATVVGGAVLKVVQCLQVSGHSRGAAGGVRPQVQAGGVATGLGGAGRAAEDGDADDVPQGALPGVAAAAAVPAPRRLHRTSPHPGLLSGRHL